MYGYVIGNSFDVGLHLLLDGLDAAAATARTARMPPTTKPASREWPQTSPATWPSHERPGDQFCARRGQGSGRVEC